MPLLSKFEVIRELREDVERLFDLITGLENYLDIKIEEIPYTQRIQQLGFKFIPKGGKNEKIN